MTFLQYLKNNTSQNHLKFGFTIFILGTLALFSQFFLYFLQSNIAETTDLIGYSYYLLAAFSHAGLFALIPYLSYILLSVLIPYPRINQGFLITSYFLLNLTAYINGIVFQLYKFHINGLVIDMLFDTNAAQIFTFDTSLILKLSLKILLWSLIGAALLWMAYRFHTHLKKRYIRYYFYFLISCILSTHLLHAYAAASNQFSIQNVTSCLPQFYPLTANKLLAKLGVAPRRNSTPSFHDTGLNTGIVYPLNRLDYKETDSGKNIIFIIIDSWSARTFTPETMPNLFQFARKSSVYTRHLSSSNGTRGSIFGMFFGISPTYWHAFELSNIQPLFIKTLLQRNFDIQAYPSATLRNPPFNQIIFGSIPEIRTETAGDTPFERDTQLTDDFLRYIDRPKDRPFFAFLFYDLLHAISIPAPYRQKFKPSWDYANYMALNNDTDPTPYFNLYRNCGWYVDSLIGNILDKLEAKNLLKESVILITGDHSQEFNENKKNYWGHGSNYSDAQIHVPFIYYDDSRAPRTYTHTTTHYDIVPTLMNQYLGIANPPEEYSMGYLLSDSLPPAYHLTGTEENYAIITPHAIYEKKHSGKVVITDSMLNPIKHNLSPQLLKEIIEYKNRFRKRE